MNPQPPSVFWYALAAMLAAAGLAFYSMYALRPPRALPADAPAAEFSGFRAKEHAFACSSKSHPAGSNTNDETAAYLLKTLQEMGVEAEFMSKSELSGATMQLQQAVIGRIRGTDSTGSVAFSAHYDSVPYGPGATDDIAGCIVMLETARAFMNRPRLRNDLVFAFLDAEEVGGYGANGFCSHPFAKDIGVITNLDVRGTKGPAMVYETSSGNGALIAELRKAGARGVLPVASSLMFSIYDRSPFGSDFTKFRNAGKRGYNVAYIDNFMWYHTMNDSPEHVHPPSIQHMGAYTLGLAEHFGNVDFRSLPLERDNDMYFNTLGYNMVQYPGSWGTPLALMAVLFLVVVILAGIRAGRISISGFLVSLLVAPVVTLLAALAALAMLAVVFGYEHTLYLYTVRFTYIPGPRAFYYSNMYCYAFGAMAIALAGLAFSLACRRLRPGDLYAACLVWLCPALAVLVMLFPGGSFLITWPLLFGSLGLAVVCLGTRGADIHPGWLLAASLFAIPALCLLPPAWLMMVWMLMILAAPGVAGLAAALLFNLVPVLALIGRARRLWFVYPAFALAVLALMGTGLALSRPSRDCPEMNSVAYFADLDRGAAWWLSEDAQVDAWTRQLFPSEQRAAIDDLLPGKGGTHYLRAEAPVAAGLGGLVSEKIGDRVREGKRVVTLRLRTADAPFEVRLRQVEGPPITAAKIDGCDLPKQDGSFSCVFQLFPKQGYELSFETAPDGAVTFEALSSMYGFPEVPGVLPRPDAMVPEPNTMRNGIHLRGEHMYVRNRVVLPPADGQTQDETPEITPMS